VNGLLSEPQLGVPDHRVWDVPLLPFRADLIDFLRERKERDQCLEEPFSDDHDWSLLRVNAIAPGKEVIADLYIAVRSRDAIWLADALTGDSDPHFVEYSTNRVAAGLELVTELCR
jgi:hypothetical protein